MAAVRTPSARKKTQKRQGAHEVKQIEITADEHDKLSPESATSYRALVARANYRSQDRVDMCYIPKELRRDVSSPSIRSWGPFKKTCARGQEMRRPRAQ